MNTSKEIWKDIKGYEGLYQVSTKGRVKSLGRTIFQKGRRTDKRFKRVFPMRIMKGQVDKYGYLRVAFHKNKQCKNFYVHRLVATAFILNHDNLPEVNHKDENKQNNCVKKS